MMENEIWRMSQYENLEVSNIGNVRSITHRDKLGRLHPGCSKRTKKLRNGYVATSFGHRANVLVHRMVAFAFVPNPNNYADVNHIDGNKENNTPLNLEWCTKSQNQKHRYDILHKVGEHQMSGFAKYANEKKMRVRSRIPVDVLNTKSLKDLSLEYGISKATLSRMRNGK